MLTPTIRSAFARRNFSVLALSVSMLAVAGPAQTDGRRISMDVSVRAIDHFRIGSSNDTFGDLEFAGGLEMYGSSRHFGALSGLHVFEDQSRFLGVADTGFWYGGRIERDRDGTAIGLSDVYMRSISGPNGETDMDKWDADAEGVTVDNDVAIVSFEREHRIARYKLDGDDAPTFIEQFPPPVQLKELRRNRGFESITVAPKRTTLDGALVGISEKSLDRAGNIMAFAIPENGRSFQFSVKRKGEFDITDAKFLPDGDLILLERRFNVQDGIGMRLRRIAGKDVVEGATVDGEILLEADLLYQIDNMEGLSITTDPDGTPRLTMVSDDNHSILQRNVLLEFRLTGGETGVGPG